MHVNVARLEAARAGAVQRSRRGCVMRKRLTFHQGLVARSPTWLNSIHTGLSQRTRVDQSGFQPLTAASSGSSLLTGWSAGKCFDWLCDKVYRRPFPQMGRSIICGQPRLRRSHRKGCYLYLQSIRFVVLVPFSHTFSSIGDPRRSL